MTEPKGLARRSRPALLVAAITLLFGLAVTTPHAASTTFTVNSTVDEPNATLGSPVCSSTPSGVCTLRAAIMAANANPGADTILIPADTFHLTIPGTDDLAQVGDLDITGDLTVMGAGDGLTIIDGSQLTLTDRLFDIRPGAVVTMSGVTIQHGSAPDRGGAIRIGDPSVADGGATLHISNCSLLDNHAPSSGGAFVNADANSSLDVTHCSFVGNTSGFGGAIHNNGSLSVVDSGFISNTVNTEGGALYSQAGTASISSSTFSTNSSLNGAAIANGGGRMTILGGTISTNFGGQGAGILNDAALVIS